MPNRDNLLAPILIVGAGRTASSYALHMLKMRGDVQTLIENELIMNLAEVIYKSWWSRNWKHECRTKGLNKRFMRLARQSMKIMFPSDKPYWAYKAIWEDIDWQLYQMVYPEANYIHLVRDPRTNIASMMDFIGIEEGHPHWNLEYASKKYIASNKKALELVDLDVPYLRIKQEDFIDYPKSTWAKICDHVGLSFIELNFDMEVHAAESQKGRVRNRRKDAKTAWKDLSKDVIEVAEALGYVPEA
jgi:hypothetical protein